MNIRLFLSVALLLLAFSFNATAQQAIDNTHANEAVYRLGSGDKLRLIVYGEQDLSGEFEVDGAGTVSLPLIGNINCSNLSLRELETLVTEKFKDGYLVNPKVSIEVLNFRPFFILGEVKKPGSYNYVSGLTALNAVALAGGFSYRAKQDEFTIIRIVGGKRQELEAHEDTLIMPGDSLRIEERFF
ncbi:MAG: polysaccharide export protein [Proteobacteria bacterium]|nr:polysaccharide export protein [Pseudomonadota bacterium]